MDRPEIWWRLLGPSKYVTKIAEAIRAAPIVAVSVPDGHLPDYMLHIGAEVVELDGYLTWSDVRLGDETIISAISTQTLTRQRTTIKRASDLVGMKELEHEVIVLGRGDVAQQFEEVCVFVAEFAAAATRQPEAPRPTILIDLPPDKLKAPALNGMGDDRVRIFPWRGYVSRHDMLSYVSHLMIGREEESPITPSFLTTMVSYIAGWDPRLATHLARSERDEILDMWPHLRAMVKDTPELDGTWAMGFEDTISGKSVRHALWLAKHDKKNEFDRIVWAAHLTELFPWLEEKRLEFVEEYRDSWKLPIDKPPRPPIMYPEDLELGEMFYNLTRMARIPGGDLPLLQTCKEIRHDLAHRRAVSSMRVMKLERLIEP